MNSGVAESVDRLDMHLLLQFELRRAQKMLRGESAFKAAAYDGSNSSLSNDTFVFNVSASAKIIKAKTFHSIFRSIWNDLTVGN